MVEGSTYTQQVQNLQFQSHWYKDHAVVKELQSPYYLGNQQLCFVLHVAFKIRTKIIQAGSPEEADRLIPSDISKVSFIWPWKDHPSLGKTNS